MPTGWSITHSSLASDADVEEVLQLRRPIGTVVDRLGERLVRRPCEQGTAVGAP